MNLETFFDFIDSSANEFSDEKMKILEDIKNKHGDEAVSVVATSQLMFECFSNLMTGLSLSKEIPQRVLNGTDNALTDIGKVVYSLLSHHMCKTDEIKRDVSEASQKLIDIHTKFIQSKLS